MIKKRLIARLDVKNNHVIKGIHLEGLRKVGVPNDLALKYYEAGIDEIVFMDAVAAYYDRNSLSEIIKQACHSIFVPITVGGGIRCLEDVAQALRSGADKVAINTAAIKRPEFITEASKVYGAQCIVGSIECKSTTEGKWEAYYDNGREPAGYYVVEWCRKLEQLGAGELLITSIDQEGTKKGFDEDLITAVANAVSIPVIASGGCGSTQHMVSALSNCDVDALAVASLLHYNIESVEQVKQQLNAEKVNIRL